MLRLAALFGLLGLASATIVIIASGFDQIVQALATAGWGIVAASLCHLLPMIFCVIGWRLLVPGKKRPSHVFFLYVLWLRSAVNSLMPVARIGGEVVAVRLMMKRGMRKTTAIATTMVELTMSVLAVFIFDMTGIIMFTLHVANHAVGLKLALGLLLSLPIIGAMLVAQRIGFFGLLSKIFTLMFREQGKKFAVNTAALDRAVHAIYRRRGRILSCGFWQLMAWVSGTVEIAVALHMLGHPLPVSQAFMIEALIQASSSAAFAVPGALGVQEAGFMFFGHMLGLAPDIAVALAVMRRCRDLVLFVPALIVWQAQEGNRMLQSFRQSIMKVP